MICICGKEFTPSTKNQKSCSHNCAKKLWRLNNKEKVQNDNIKHNLLNKEKKIINKTTWQTENQKTCECGKTFLPIRKNQSFCCKTCAKKASNHTYYIKNKSKVNAYVKKYREENPEKINELNRVWYKENSDKAKATSIKWQKENPDKLWQVRNKEKQNEKCKKYNKNNRAKIQAQKTERYNSDPEFNIATRLRGRLGIALRAQGTNKAGRTEELVGLPFEELKKYIESLFVDGMTWENRKLWDIDHIKPVSSFDLTNPEEQKKCFHYTNLQPLWKEDNLKKGAKF
jgi:hypothetical protein